VKWYRKAADQWRTKTLNNRAPNIPREVLPPSSPEMMVERLLYLTSHKGKESQFADLFALNVNYFGQEKTRSQILKEELEFHRDWSIHRFELSGTINRTGQTNGIVTLHYEMKSSIGKDTGAITSDKIKSMEMVVKKGARGWEIVKIGSRK
jgi:hypothetical protein